MTTNFHRYVILMITTNIYCRIIIGSRHFMMMDAWTTTTSRSTAPMRLGRRPSTRRFAVVVVVVPTIYGPLECTPIPITIPIYDTAQHDNNNNNNNNNNNRLAIQQQPTITTTIVEATASTQNQLVDYVLQQDDDEDEQQVIEEVDQRATGSALFPNEEATKEFRPQQPPPPPPPPLAVVPRPSSMQDPYGAVLWPSARAVTSYLLSHYTTTTTNGQSESQQLLDLLFHGNSSSSNRGGDGARPRRPRRTHIIELGCGTGLISLSLYHQAIQFLNQQQQSSSSYEITIRATDYEMVPLQLVQYAAQMYPTRHENGDNDPTNSSGSTVSDTNLTNRHELSRRTFTDGPNRVTLVTQWFNVCDMSRDLTWPDDTDQVLIVVADLLYDTTTARALAQRIVSWLNVPPPRRHNATNVDVQVVIGDSPGRLGRPIFLQELQRHGYYTTSSTQKSTTGSDHHDDNMVSMTTNHSSSFVTTTVVMGQTVTTPRNELICGPTSTSRSSDPQPLEIDILHF